MWNYRAILHDVEIGLHWVGLHEVFYDEDGAVTGWTEDEVGFVCDEDEIEEGSDAN